MALRRGSRFGPYRIEEPISAGGMGAVYRALDEELDRIVALKVMGQEISSDPGFRRRFEREARLAARVAHPNIASVYRRGDTNGRLWIAMEYIAGHDLGAILRAGPMAADSAVAVLRAVAGALDAVHRENIVHRDVKPANIVVSSGPDRRVYLVDFGIAHAGERTRYTSAGLVVGTPGFVAPERLTHDHPGGPPSDLYSLGCVAYQMLEGRPPFDGPLALVHVAQLEGRTAPLSPSLRRATPVFERALARRPEDRYETATSFVQALAGAVGGPRDTHEPAIEPRPRAEDPEEARARWVDVSLEAAAEQQRSQELAVLLDAASRLPGRRLKRRIENLLRQGHSPADRRAVAAALPDAGALTGQDAVRARKVLADWAGPSPRRRRVSAPSDPSNVSQEEFEAMVRALGAEEPPTGR